MTQARQKRFSAFEIIILGAMPLNRFFGAVLTVCVHMNGIFHQCLAVHRIIGGLKSMRSSHCEHHKPLDQNFKIKCKIFNQVALQFPFYERILKTYNILTSAMPPFIFFQRIFVKKYFDIL